MALLYPLIKLVPECINIRIYLAVVEDMYGITDSRKSRW